MTKRLTRREMLAGLALGASAAANLAASPAATPITAPVGVDTYTLRAFRWDAFEMLDYAARVKLDVVQFSEFPHLGAYEIATTKAYQQKVRARADELGIRLEMGTWGVCPTNLGRMRRYGTAEEQLALAIDAAVVLGSKSVRCVMGSGNLRRKDGPLERHVEAMIGAFRNVRSRAVDAGVRLALENHKDLRATEMLDLVETAGKEYVGCCLDTGNPMEVLEDPMDTVEILASVAVTSHFRDSSLWKHPRGAAFQWTAMGDGSVRIGEVVKRFVELCPGVSINLEIITGRPAKVLPYREPGFWKGFEKLTGQELIRFDELAAKGEPLLAGMVVPNNDPQNPAYREAVKEQMRVDFERSLRFLREEVGIVSPA